MGRTLSACIAIVNHDYFGPPLMTPSYDATTKRTPLRVARLDLEDVLMNETVSRSVYISCKTRDCIETLPELPMAT